MTTILAYFNSKKSTKGHVSLKTPISCFLFVVDRNCFPYNEMEHWLCMWRSFTSKILSNDTVKLIANTDVNGPFLDFDFPTFKVGIAE
jgi:hypothetical protein